MTDTTELIARLRNRPNDSPLPAEYLMDECIEAIETQAAEIRRAERELENLRAREHTLRGDHAECDGLRVCWYKELTSGGKTQDEAVSHINNALSRYRAKFGK